MNNNLDLEASETLIETAMITGMMPVACERAQALMLTNGKEVIFVPSNKELSFEQKIIAMRTLATARGLDPNMFIKAAMNNPSSIDKVISGLYSSALGQYREDYAGLRRRMVVSATIEAVSRNDEALAREARLSGFSVEASSRMADNVGETLKSMKHMIGEVVPIR